MGRHLALVFRGTGGVVGEDYVSRVCQAASNYVEEINPEFPATMGGLPVGTAGGPDDPSMAWGVNLAVEDAKHIIAQRPDQKIVIGGYSAGAVAAAKVRQYVLETMPERYVCSFSFGDPTRPTGGAFFAGKPADGHGISPWRYGDVKDWRHCWLAQNGDMYTSVPEGDTGLIMGDFYDIITQLQLSDPLGTFGVILKKLPDILTHIGVLGESRHQKNEVVLAVLNLATQALQQQKPGKQMDLFGGLLSSLGVTNPTTLALNSIVGLLDGEPDDIAAAIYAAIVAIKFAAEGTAPHINYEFARPQGYGGTYLDLAIQHVRDWSSRK